MVLNNYWKAFQLSQNLEVYGGSYTNTGMVKQNGDALPPVPRYIRMGDSTNTFAITVRSEGISAVVGSGTGTITPNDYALFNDCTSDFTNFSVSNSAAAENDGFSQVLTISGTNNTENEITLTEVGITKSYTQVQSGTGGEILFTKQLLSTPVTVPAGGSFQLSVKWEEK